MSQRIFLMLVAGLLWGASSSYAQQKEYITFSDTKGKIIDCKGRAGFQGATLTIKFPTLAAYQKQYSRHHLVLDPDPPANLTLELGGYDGPCSRYETDASRERGTQTARRSVDPSENYPKAPSHQKALVLINAWMEFANSTKPKSTWKNGYKLTPSFQLPYCANSNKMKMAVAEYDESKMQSSYNPFNDYQINGALGLDCKPDNNSDDFGAISFGYKQHESVTLPSGRPIITAKQLSGIKFLEYKFCSGYAMRYVVANGKEYVFNDAPLISCKRNESNTTPSEIGGVVASDPTPNSSVALPQTLTRLPKEPTTEDGKNALNTLSGYDGFGNFCRDGKTFSALLTKKENGNWVLRKTPQKESCTIDESKKFIFEPVHE